MPVFAIVDCNSFFCSCERLINPALKGKPVIVLSNNDGMVVARTKEAKALGIKWDAYHLIKGVILAHRVQVYSSNYPLYSEISGRVMSVLKTFSPRVEVYSCDEAFLDLTGVDDLDGYGRLIKETIEQHCGIPVSIGIARTKTLAKLANHLAKNSSKLQTGVLNLVDSPYLDEALKRVEVQDIWGVGRRWSERLRHCGIKTAYDLAQKDEKWILKKFNIVLTRTALELQAKFCLPLQLEPPISKSIMSSMSFGKLVTEFRHLRQVISTYAAHSAEKMRREGLACSNISVFLQTNRFIDEPQYNPWIKIHLPYPTDNTHDIIKHALIGLDGIFREGYRYNKAGAMVDGLIPANQKQTSLLEVYDRDRVSELMGALDKVNAVFGPGTLRYGSQGFRDTQWRVRQNHLSSQNTQGLMTDFQEVERICELGQSTHLIRAL